MTMRLRFPLMLMMFFEYAVWGAWMPVIGATLHNRGIRPEDIGYVFAAHYLATIITPFLGGQIADRLMPSQVFLAISHLLAAGAAIVLSNQTGAQNIILWVFIWSLIFAPSLGITNSIVFHHLGKVGLDEAGKEREFSWIRTAGTVGWIVAAFILLAYFRMTHIDQNAVAGPMPEWRVAAGLGVVMAVICLFLPNTPPSKDKKADPLAFREALFMFKAIPGFAVFMIISFIAATEFQFFYVLSGQFIESLGIPHELIGPWKSVSQAAEILALAVLLPIALVKKGMRWTLIVGCLAWAARYAIFAVGQPVGLVLASLSMHGIGYAFVIVVQQLFVDRVAPRDIRASAQNLLNLITLGIGNWFGAVICGHIQQMFSRTETVDGVSKVVTNWPPVFILPAILSVLCAIAYYMTFREPKEDSSEAAGTTPQPVLAGDR